MKIIKRIPLFLILIMCFLVSCNNNSPEERYYNVCFDSNGGTDVDKQIIKRDGKIEEPEKKAEEVEAEPVCG